MLEDVYKNFRGPSNNLKPEISDHFYPPLLVRPDASWRSAKNRLAWIGQETFGPVWNFDRERAEPLSTLTAFFGREDSIEVLLKSYTTVEETFAAARLPRGYFWSYLKATFEELNKDGPTSAIWTNLIRCAADGESNYTLASIDEPQRVRYLEWQHGMISQELAELAPTLAIFVTGPQYDKYLLSEFPGLKLRPVAGFSEREVARLDHEALHFPTFRTYHPNYLNRMDHLKQNVITAILGEAHRA
jgi:hypothetical protein